MWAWRSFCSTKRLSDSWTSRSAAVAFPGTDISETRYRDSKGIEGTLSDIAQRSSMSVSTVRRVLGRLRSAGLVRREGARKNGEWKTVPPDR